MVCPKCGTNIARFDLSPNCKKCGVHIMYYTQEEDLARDAKKCELEFAKTRVLVEKIKLAFVKNRLSLARMIIIIIGAGCLFIPYAGFSANLPFFSQNVTVSAWGAYQLFSDGLLMQIPNILTADTAQQTAILLFASLALFVVTVLVLLGIFATLLLGFINLRKSCRVMMGLSITAAVLCVSGIVLAFVFKSTLADSALFSASVGAGYFVMLALLGVLIAVNAILYRNDPQPAIKEIDLERIEILKKVKSGEVSLDSLSLPVCYSEEEEQNRANFLGNTEKKAKKSKKAKKGGDDRG